MGLFEDDLAARTAVDRGRLHRADPPGVVHAPIPVDLNVGRINLRRIAGALEGHEAGSAPRLARREAGLRLSPQVTGVNHGDGRPLAGFGGPALGITDGERIGREGTGRAGAGRGRRIAVRDRGGRRAPGQGQQKGAQDAGNREWAVVHVNSITNAAQRFKPEFRGDVGLSHPSISTRSSSSQYSPPAFSATGAVPYTAKPQRLVQPPRRPPGRLPARHHRQVQLLQPLHLPRLGDQRLRQRPAHPWPRFSGTTNRLTRYPLCRSLRPSSRTKPTMPISPPSKAPR